MGTIHSGNGARRHDHGRKRAVCPAGGHEPSHRDEASRRLGGDTDTTAAIVGGILGCQLQDVTADIPWLPRVLLPESALIEATATGLQNLRQSLCP